MQFVLCQVQLALQQFFICNTIISRPMKSAKQMYTDLSLVVCNAVCLVFEAVCFSKCHRVQTTRLYTSEASVISIH